ncbi:MAG: orotidine-5'-phosphate decarboxylase [Candidatus Omnitrophica bacterium]|nr:orotidine-5'-phosphate decarboxylase [Candidatus Omnitrophota bacterium]
MENTAENKPVGSPGALLSSKPIPPAERLIFALDLATVDAAKRWVESLGDSVQFYKLGLQIFMAGHYFELIEWLVRRNKKVMADLKFFDVPATVGAAVAQLKNRRITFATVHGNDGMLQAAVENRSGVKILAVTALTSLDQGDLNDLGFQCNAEQLVLSRARRALNAGCDGVVSSGLEVRKLRQELGNQLIIVTPGIRPVVNKEAKDDQKRTADIEDAFLNGADYIVVGRPIRQAPDPKLKAQEFQHRIATLFASSTTNL